MTRSLIFAQRPANRAIEATKDALGLMEEGRLEDAATFIAEAERHLARAQRMLKEARDEH